MDTGYRTLLSRTFMVVAVLILPATTICGGFGPSVHVDATIAAGLPATQQAEASLQATISAAVAATQVASQAGGPAALTTPGFQAPISSSSMPDTEQVRTIILAEVNGTVARDLNLLKSLYAPEAVVVDHSGTPDDPADDTTWPGWVNIERRYSAFFSTGISSLTLVELTIQVNGNRATAVHQGAVLDGTFYPDKGIYTLEKIDGQWLITQLEYGYKKRADSPPVGAENDQAEAQPPRNDGLYVLKLGNQHRYEEPWGWDRGDPCKAWETGIFDDTKPNYRGFNIELLLTNNSDTKVPDAWPISFKTAKGKSVNACYYGYEGSGPQPGATSSVTFFTVVETGDYVEKITFSLNDQTVQLCLDGQGGWSPC